MLRFIAAVLCLVPAALGAGMRAGVAKLDITPEGPIWLSGYGDRTHPSTGVLMKLWAKALALEDSKGGRVVIVTTDLIGLPRAITDPVSARIEQVYGLERSRVLFNSSHTHTGPVVRSNLMTMFDLSPEDKDRIQAYGSRLSEALFQVVGGALGDLVPADLAFGSGETGFAINRRQPAPQGVKIGVNPSGPVDRAVPVIRVMSGGKVKAVLFGYACHNTTMTGQNYQISGDYAGFAQQELEKSLAGATALFIMLCGGDQNPEPRGTPDLAEKHGEELALEVKRVLDSPMTKVEGPIRTAFDVTELQFAPHTRETFEAQLKSTRAAEVRRAEAMLKAYDERRPVRTTPYPVQAIRFAKGPAILALGGEVVVDYDLRVKREYAGPLIVAGYSNDVMCYIPSKRVLGEGGYEAVDSMIYYGQPGPFADDVEERIFTEIGKTLKRVGVRPAAR
jgi:hypothetical protein